MSKQAWNTPDGSQSDFRQTFFGGQSMPVAWKACNNSIDDIWITSFDEDAFPYSHLLKKQVDLAQNGSFNWTVDVPAHLLASNAKYVFRFKPTRPDGTYEKSDIVLSSPGFLILPGTSNKAGIAATSQDTVPSALLTAAAAPTLYTSYGPAPTMPTIGTGAANATSPQPDTTDGAPFMSTGVIIGITAGIAACLAFLAALVVLHCCIFKRRRKQGYNRRRDPGLESGMAKGGLRRNQPSSKAKRQWRKTSVAELDGKPAWRSTNLYYENPAGSTPAMMTGKLEVPVPARSVLQQRSPVELYGSELPFR